MKFGVPLGMAHPRVWRDLAVEADRLGFDSVWLPEHLVFATDVSAAVSNGAYPYENVPNLSPATPLFDAPAYLCALAAVTSRIRLGTAVYLFGLRHPFVAARAFATLDQISGGRAIAGVGAGWYEAEWTASGIDFRSRGRRLDEAIAVARRLWTEETVEHHGEFFDFPEVGFEPKPVQRPLPILAGGETPAALRRAARCDGWIGMPHTLESVRPRLDALRTYRDGRDGRDGGFEITAHAYELSGPDEVAEWERLGVDRLIVRPWRRSKEAVHNMADFAAAYGIIP
jgi:probable F420-dependent oxidoreductase